MKKNKISKNWVNKQRRDIYVRQSKVDGYRARSAYKLIEIDEKFKIFKGGLLVIDIGAAPGSWSQYTSKIVKNGKTVSIDLKEMEPIPNTIQIKGDFTKNKIQQEIKDILPGNADVVMSDMAPNISGNRVVDQARAMNLAEDAFRFAIETLNEGGSFLTKLFQGEGFEEFIGVAKQHFESVRIFKPKASRSESREVYMLARTYGI